MSVKTSVSSTAQSLSTRPGAKGHIYILYRAHAQYKRGTWNTAFNRAVLLADRCIEMDASVLIQQQMP